MLEESKVSEKGQCQSKNDVNVKLYELKEETDAGRWVKTLVDKRQSELLIKCPYSPCFTICIT